MKRIYIAILGISIPFIVLCQEIKLSDNLYAIINNKGGNVAICICPDEVILVDDQMTTSVNEIDSIVSSICDQKIGTIINTHFHYDHVDGNKHYGKSNIKIISHYTVRKRLGKNQTFWVPPYKQEAFPDHALPTITFSDSLTVYKSNETIQLYHLKNAHTDGDVFVKFVNANVIHTGDIVMTFGLPFIDGDNGGNIYGMISALGKLIECSNDSTKIIPGHGEISTRNDLINYKELLSNVEERIRAGILNGLTLEEFIALDPFKGLDVGYNRYFNLEDAYLNVKEYLESSNSKHSNMK